MSKYSFDAVIFDLDGVITKTALVHSHAWKKMFDEYLLSRQDRFGEPFREFSHEQDYLTYVDGKPRYEGVNSFLQSRGINIPLGEPADTTRMETVCGLGNRKNEAFNEVLDREGVEVFKSTVDFMKQLRENGIHIGVASSSKNCLVVLKAAGLLDLIETRVDGEVSARIGLKGKPQPDIFLTAAKNLGVKASRSVVVEDAVSGVAAGRAGNFGLVLGLAREENETELYANGADIVLSDMEETSLEDVNRWFTEELEEDNWAITYHTYEQKKERSRESLLAIGNGYFGTRGAFEESKANPVNYPGTYIAGLYNRLITPIAGKEIENEDFVNAPNWLPVTFKINDGEWFDINKAEIEYINRHLNFKNGLLTKRLEIRDPEGRETLIVSQRYASMQNPHLAALQYTIIPLNYSGKLTIRTGIDGSIINEGVERYKALNQQHLKPVEQGSRGNTQYVLAETTQSGILIAEVASYEFSENEAPVTVHLRQKSMLGTISGEVTFDAEEGNLISMVKKVAIYTNKPDDCAEPLKEAFHTIDNAGSFWHELGQSETAWATIWGKIDIRISGDRFSQKLMRLHLYHLMVSMSPNNRMIDASITARGLHGEAYRGHIFWDELFILPFYNLHLPEVSKAMLMYRYNRLDKAREYAKEYGYKGAMFPWQSGSDGREETQVIHLNPLNGSWDPDHSSLQRHVSLAIACNTWQYFHMTGDIAFMAGYGAELFFEICRFWASKSKLNPQTGKYSIDKVMGPDEFHEQYPDSSEGGIRDNAYTNLMVAWSFEKANAIVGSLDIDTLNILKNRIGLTEQELQSWNEIASKLNLVIDSSGIIAQYDGYFELKELNWDFYKKKYGNIYRMDRILKSEGLSPDEFKVAKQADMLMIFYNFDKEVVDRLLQKLGYSLPPDYLERNLDYYLHRTSHGSTLSRVVHGKLALMAGDAGLSWQLYADALSSDYNDIQGGTTAEGIHAGVMAGTALIAITTYAGFNFDGEILSVNPALPPEWEEMSFGFSFRNVNYTSSISHDIFKITADKVCKVSVRGKVYMLEASKSLEVK